MPRETRKSMSGFGHVEMAESCQRPHHTHLAGPHVRSFAAEDIHRLILTFLPGFVQTIHLRPGHTHRTLLVQWYGPAG